MKFYCDACNTKYAISDEKVRGKVLKVRCKKCDNIITVREARTPAGEAAGAASNDTGVPQSNWYFAVNGVTEGPLGLEEIRDKFRSGEVGDEAYVWHDTFDKWEPVADVDTFKSALAAGQALKPRAKTLGFTGKLEAVKAPAGANKSKSGAVPTPSKKAAPTAEPSKSSKALEQPPEKSQSAPREDKLAALRAKLKEKKQADAAARPAVEIPKPASKSAAPVTEPEDAAAKPETDKPAAESKPLPTPSLPTPKAEASEPAALATPPRPEPAAESDALESIPDVAPAGLETPSTTSTSDIFDIPPAVDEDELEDDQDAVPFFPPANVAAAGPAEQSALTGSLLIQLDQIQKKGRGSKFFAVAILILFVGSAVAIGSYIYLQPESDGEDAFTRAEGPGSGEHRELNFRTYSDDDHRKILELGDEELTMEFDEDEAAEIEGDGAVAGKGKTTEKAPSKVAAKPKTDSATESGGAAKPAAEEPAEKSDDSGKTLALARIKDSAESGDGKPSAEETRRKAELFRSATSNVKRESTTIARPQDKLQGSVDPNATLTREQALAGMKRVSRSVQLCRERHMRRGGTFDSQKIFVTVTVKGDGRVSDFDAEPRTLSNTEFGRCMNSHKGRWRFAAYGGKPQQVRRRFIIQ